MWARVAAENGYTKTSVDQITLMPTGRNGEYQVMSGTSWLPGRDGKPITIDVTRYSYPSAALTAAPQSPSNPGGVAPAPTAPALTNVPSDAAATKMRDAYRNAAGVTR